MPFSTESHVPPESVFCGSLKWRRGTTTARDVRQHIFHAAYVAREPNSLRIHRVKKSSCATSSRRQFSKETNATRQLSDRKTPRSYLCHRFEHVAPLKHGKKYVLLYRQHLKQEVMGLTLTRLWYFGMSI